MSALKILVIPGSLRTGSHNARLAAAVAYELAQAGAEVTRISLGDFPLPIYDGDLQTKSGVPKHAINLKRMMSAHHGVLIVTPEYNSSVPPLVTKPMLTRLKLIRDAFIALAPGAPFVQFTYSVAPPIPKSLPGVSTEASERIWMNLPPARVWVYRKD